MSDGLPGGWAPSTLGDVVEILDSMRVPVNSEERQIRPGTIPYYGATGQVGTIDDYLFDEELILLGEDGAPFLESTKPKAYLIRGKAWVNNHAHVLRARAGVSSLFVLHQLNQVDYANFVSGTTRLKLPQAPMRRIPIRLAPQREQCNIVAEIEKQFTRLDAAVAALKRVQANLKRYRAAVLKAACEGRLVPTEADLARKEGRSYETGEQLLARILKERRAKWEADQLAKMIAAGKAPKNDEWKKKYKEPVPPETTSMPPMPEGWNYATVEQLTAPNDGLVTGPFGTLIGKADHRPDGIPVAGIPNITGRGFLPGSWFCVTPNKAQELARYMLHAGDVVVSRSGTVGEACVITSGHDPLLMSTNLMRMRTVGDTVSGPWLVVNFKGNETIAKQLEQLCKGSTRPFLNLGILSALLVKLPPITEQDRVLTQLDRVLSDVESLEDSVNAQLARADRLRQSILKRTFEGRLVPQDPSDEPATALLESICSERGTKATEEGNLRRQRQRRPMNTTVT